MRIAVIGSSGFIGTELCAAACGAGNSVRGLDYAKPRQTVDGFEFVDLSATCDVYGALQDCDAAVLLAARRPTASFSHGDYSFNVSLGAEYFSVFHSLGIKNVVFASSTAAYSGGAMPWRETDACPPYSMYGASKAATDALALYYNASKGMNIKCLRFAQVIGMGERKGFLLNTLIDNAIAGRTQIIYGHGSAKKQYIYVKDVSAAILAALSKGDCGGIYNIGMRYSYSALELAQCINRVFGNEGNLVHDYTKPESTDCFLMDVTKAERELGFTAAYGLEDAFCHIRDGL
ncbi:MAG: NAD(P)-dependent oxidoreductase [Clostridia bacterium]|nr:NAD(P)-dependent oxidoreductase [Clostridia bacterium]